MPGIDERSLEAVAKLASAPVSIQATTLRRGDPQLVFTGNSEQYVSTRASFIASIP
jgi:hypothetical protein